MQAPLESLLTQAWMQRGWLAWLLRPLSFLYALLSAAHRWWYRQGPGVVGRVPIPVIVVGNVVAGGAGKTPVVMALVEHLRSRGFDVGIVSRGHGRRSRDAQLIGPASTAEEAGDEPLLLARRCGVPVAVARRRLEGAKLLITAHPGLQVIVSDDGLQHHALHHDIALCVFDDRGLGNGWLLPAGPLREPWPRQHGDASVQWLVNTGDSPSMPGFHARRRLATHAINGQGQSLALAHWHNRPVTAVAGIAHPGRFFDMLQACKLEVRRTPLPDHATREQLTSALWAAPDPHSVLCTEKDAVKLWPHHPEVWAVPLETRLPTELLDRIDQVLDTRLSSTHGHQTA
jgi:tetraacyldisaccharide 4'-kinase